MVFSLLYRYDLLYTCFNFKSLLGINSGSDCIVKAMLEIFSIVLLMLFAYIYIGHKNAKFSIVEAWVSDVFAVI